MKRWAGALVLALALTGCGSARPRHPSALHVQPVPPKALVKLAKRQIGVPYERGSEDPKRGFDCSGLVFWCYQQLGSAIPRQPHLQWAMGHRVKSTQLQPGDLVFFDTEGITPGHVGIVTDPPNFVHAPSSGKRVRIDSVKNVYWSKHFYGAKRVD